MDLFCASLTRYVRRTTHTVRVGRVEIGGENPIRLQSMTNTDTNDTATSAAQVERIAGAGGELVRLTAQGRREAENLADIRRVLHERECTVPLVADIHFLPEAAIVAAERVEKVRINPGNFNEKGDEFERLLAVCRRRGVALRIGVNHGSLAPAIVEEYGDTPEGMVASALAFLRRCREASFDQVVVSLKSSNVRVMVQAYRMLVREMNREQMSYPLHLGVTEAGNDAQGRIKSAVGIGALLADGIGDTIRVSLTEAPEREIPVARLLVDHVAGRADHAPIAEVDTTLYSPYRYVRRCSSATAGVGGDNLPIIYSELTAEQRALLFEATIQDLDRIPEGSIVVLSTQNRNAPAEMRAFFLQMATRGMTHPVILKRSYTGSELERLQVEAAADLGGLLLDGYGDGVWIENPAHSAAALDELALGILQAARVRISQAEYIACPGCGRTLYDLEGTLSEIRRRTAHLKGIKIGVMGCIVNGPGEMADADFGYVGAGPGRITLYKGQEVVERNIPQVEAVDRLVELIKREGRWI